MSTATLRERQAEQVRAAVLDAVVTALETKALDDISMADVAAAAGISLRTLYRYFPDRPSLLEAAGEHLYDVLGVPFEISKPADVSRSFLEAAARLGSRPALTRALVQSTAGRTARSASRSRRLAAIEAVLDPVTTGLDGDRARGAVAVIGYLCSAAAWVGVADDSGLDDEAAQRAVAWAIDALLSTLQSEARTARRESRRD
ncbi:MAG TPA: TetR/AcrR family transcriptional regulator [Mycobacteriales bacterium]|nr:TetR/AcrR family transcriptional regulator [Mycobacteriales bacterium]